MKITMLPFAELHGARIETHQHSSWAKPEPEEAQFCETPDSFYILVVQSCNINPPSNGEALEKMLAVKRLERTEIENLFHFVRTDVEAKGKDLKRPKAFRQLMDLVIKYKGAYGVSPFREMKQ